MDKKRREIIKKIFLKVFPDLDATTFDFNTPSSSFENWDSLNHLQLVSEVENTFNISLEMNEVAGIEKPEDFMSIVSRKKNG